MTTVDQLTQRLDRLEAMLPRMAASTPDPDSFWITFTLYSDGILQDAGPSVGYVRERLRSMLHDAHLDTIQ